MEPETRKIPEGPVPLGERLFVEDDALLWDRTAPKMEDEYERLTGVKFSYGDALRLEDRGDHFHYLMPTGHVVVSSYDGHSIYRSAEVGDA